MFFLETVPLFLSQGLDDRPPIPYMKAWIRRWAASRKVRSTCKAILTTVSDFVKPEWKT